MAEQVTVNGVTYTDYNKGAAENINNERRRILNAMAEHGSRGQAIAEQQRQEELNQRNTALRNISDDVAAIEGGAALEGELAARRDALNAGLVASRKATAKQFNQDFDRLYAAEDRYLREGAAAAELNSQNVLDEVTKLGASRRSSGGGGGRGGGGGSSSSYDSSDILLGLANASITRNPFGLFDAEKIAGLPGTADAIRALEDAAYGGASDQDLQNMVVELAGSLSTMQDKSLFMAMADNYFGLSSAGKNESASADMYLRGLKAEEYRRSGDPADRKYRGGRPRTGSEAGGSNYKGNKSKSNRVVLSSKSQRSGELRRRAR